MAKKRALIISVAAAIALVVAVLVLTRNDPPIGERASDDAGQYMEVDRFTEKMLADEFAPILPQQIPANATAERYTYRYCCGLLGDPAFYLDLALRFDGDDAFSQECDRLKGLGAPKTLQVGGVEYLLFACDGRSVSSYFDDEIYDGLVLPFNIAAVDQENRTIEYLTAHVQDGGSRYDRLTELLNLLESVDN